MPVVPAILLVLSPSWVAQESAPQAAPVQASLPINNLSIRLGSRTWSEDILDDIFDSQGSFAVLWDSRQALSGFGWELGAFFSSDDASASDGVVTASIDQSLFELMAGGRYTQQVGASNLFVFGSAGVDFAFSSVEAEITDGIDTVSADDTDTSVGGYLGAGAYLKVSQAVGLGLDVRRTIGTEDDNLDVDIDYTEFAVSFLLSI